MDVDAARLREEQEQLIRASRDLLSRDLLSDLSTKSGRSLNSKRRSSGFDEPQTKTPEVSEARKSQAPIADNIVPFGRDDGDRDSILSEDSQDDFPSDRTELKFVDVNSLSAGSRRTAAPHIYNIFEQIFMEDANANVPDLPQSIKRTSILKSKGQTMTHRNGESACCIRIELNQDYDEIVSPTTGRGRFQLERQVFADLSIAMNVSKQRFLLERIEPKRGWAKFSIMDLLVMPDEQGLQPSCADLSKQIVEAINSGSLNTMPSMRRAVRSEIHNRDSAQQASNRPEEKEGGLKFSLLRGGIFFDSKHISSLGNERVSGGEDTSHASHGAMEVDPGQDPEGLRIALSLQEKEMAAARRQKDERREREGFWVDVEAGKAPATASGPESMAAKYGTFAGHGSREQGRLLVVAAVAGGSAMLLLACWVLYLHIYRAGD